MAAAYLFSFGQLYSGLDDIDEYQFVGKAYIYGKMDGEALDECYQQQEFKLI